MSCGGVSELVIERRIGLANSIGGLCRLRGSTTATGNATATTTATPANATTKEVSMGKAGAGAPSGDKNASTTSSTGKDLTVAQAPAPPSRPTKPCCFCWCCCCSCSCVQKIVSLAVKNVDENGPTKKTENSDLLNCDGEPPPSLDEIRSWGKSFDKLMRSSAGRKVFRDFLRCEYSEENILFWLACEELKRETNPDVVEEKARKIYEDYISILSPKEVSLDSRVREIVNRNMVEPTPHTFDEAQLQIYTLMHRDSYPRFVNSSLFKTLAQLNSSGASDAGSNADPAEQSSQSQSQSQSQQSQQPHNNDNKKGSEEVNPSTGIVVADVTAATSTTTAAITAAPTTTVSLTSNTNG